MFENESKYAPMTPTTAPEYDEKSVSRYLANDYDNAVVVAFLDRPERLGKGLDGRMYWAQPHNAIAFGSIDNTLDEITKEDYDAFGVKWRFNENCRRVAIRA